MYSDAGSWSVSILMATVKHDGEGRLMVPRVPLTTGKEDSRPPEAVCVPFTLEAP